MGYFDNLKIVRASRGPYLSTDQTAQWAVDCPGCGSRRMLAVAMGSCPDKFEGRAGFDAESAWLMCVACGMGAFAVGTAEQVHFAIPDTEPFDIPDNLSEEVAGTWDEALMSYTATAYTSCALMCRKIIFHMAVEAGLPAKNEKDRAPGFEQCVNHLLDVGYITPRQKDQWVDSIRKWGNTATHELAPISKDVAYNALQFTHQLLQMVYAFPAAAPGGDATSEQASEGNSVPPSSGQPH